MGYQPTRKTYTLAFDDYDGLEVKVKPTSLGRLMALQGAGVNLNEEQTMELFKFFAKCVIEWNIEHPLLDDEEVEVCDRCGIGIGAALPTTVESMMCLDLDFLMVIIYGWMATVASVSAPKGLSLNNGAMTIPEELMSQLGQLQNPLK